MKPCHSAHPQPPLPNTNNLPSSNLSTSVSRQFFDGRGRSKEGSKGAVPTKKRAGSDASLKQQTDTASSLKAHLPAGLRAHQLVHSRRQPLRSSLPGQGSRHDLHIHFEHSRRVALSQSHFVVTFARCRKQRSKKTRTRRRSVARYKETQNKTRNRKHGEEKEDKEEEYAWG